MMKRAFLLVGLVSLSACAAGTSDTGSSGAPSELPPEVAAAADPRFVATARLLDDGCYWYVHRNVVEQTFLPLRTPDGRPICAVDRATREARAAAAAQAAAGEEF